ncbi:MAG: hypothetical protein HYX37_14135 [Rhizobiales bacterium]|nr:hypothetical protein [Hyphomicrobiales bacterium]
MLFFEYKMRQINIGDFGKAAMSKLDRYRMTSGTRRSGRRPRWLAGLGEEGGAITLACAA